MIYSQILQATQQSMLVMQYNVTKGKRTLQPQSHGNSKRVGKAFLQTQKKHKRRDWEIVLSLTTEKSIPYGLLTKCEVKMAGYWQRSIKRPINSQKKNSQDPAILTEQTWSTKDPLYGFWGNCACRIQWVAPRGQDGSILAARVANHSARFGSSWMLCRVALWTQMVKQRINSEV